MKSPSRSASEPASNEKPTKKPRTESDETTALRALRQLRQLDERLEASAARHDVVVTSVKLERTKLSASLSPSVAALVAKLVPAKEENGGGS